MKAFTLHFLSMGVKPMFRVFSLWTYDTQDARSCQLKDKVSVFEDSDGIAGLRKAGDLHIR